MPGSSPDLYPFTMVDAHFEKAPGIAGESVDMSADLHCEWLASVRRGEARTHPQPRSRAFFRHIRRVYPFEDFPQERRPRTLAEVFGAARVKGFPGLLWPCVRTTCCSLLE